jgi:hypothetical protein
VQTMGGCTSKSVDAIRDEDVSVHRRSASSLKTIRTKSKHATYTRTPVLANSLYKEVIRPPPYQHAVFSFQ